MNLWLTLISAGLITFAIRLSFIKLLEKLNVASFFLDALRFVPVAVLSAIAFPSFFLNGKTLDFTLHNPHWIAGTVAVIVAWKTENFFLTIGAGLVTLWILQLLISQ